jgi:phosphinothricin acetyltransferase
MIRSAAESDVPEMLCIYAPYVENTTYTFEYTVPTEEEFLVRFQDITAQFPWLVWEENGRVLGYAYGSLPFARAAYAWAGEVSIYLAADARGRGIGRKLYPALEQLMEYQGYRVLYAIITEENRISMEFHKALGYRQAGVFSRCGLKFGRWLSVVWMEKRLNSVGIPSKPPCPYKSFVENDRILSDILDKLSLS